MATLQQLGISVGPSITPCPSKSPDDMWAKRVSTVHTLSVTKSCSRISAPGSSPSTRQRALTRTAGTAIRVVSTSSIWDVVRPAGHGRKLQASLQQSIRLQQSTAVMASSANFTESIWGHEASRVRELQLHMCFEQPSPPTCRPNAQKPPAASTAGRPSTGSLEHG